MKVQTKDGHTLAGEFERLLKWQLDPLLSAHGTLLKTGAHGGAVAAAVDRTYQSQ